MGTFLLACILLVLICLIPYTGPSHVRSRWPSIKPGQVVRQLPRKWWQPEAKWVAVYAKTPMQELFTNEEIGMILKYKIQWTSVEQARRLMAALAKTEAR